MEIANLSRIPLFSDISEESMHWVAERCTLRNYNQGEQIIDRHGKDFDLYFVIKGRARVVNYSLTGREVSFDDCEEGEYFGELSAIDGKPRSANVVALENMVVAVLLKSDFIQLLTKEPKVTVVILRGLAKIVRTSNNRIMDLSTVGAYNRVHGELLRLARAGISQGNKATIEPVPIHSDIASRVSTTRETVNRAFSDLARRGIINRQQNSLLIDDLERLTKIVEQVRGEID